MRDIPDFPRPGIVFKDITPLLLDPPAIETAVDGLVAWSRPREVDFVVAAERGGSSWARRWRCRWPPASCRPAPGKLPSETVTYDGEG